MKNQSNILWVVRWKALMANSSNGGLLILADNVEVAARKATRVLKRDGHRAIQIKAVEFEGTIDAF